MNSDAIKQVIDSGYKYIWDWPAAFPYFIVLLLGTGIFLTARLRVIQLRKISHSLAIIAGYYDDHCVLVYPFDLLQKRPAVHLRHIDICNHHVCWRGSAA